MAFVCYVHDFCSEYSHVRNFKIHMHIADRCARWKVSKHPEHPVLQTMHTDAEFYLRRDQTSSAGTRALPSWFPALNRYAHASKFLDITAFGCDLSPRPVVRT
jgi:hypothetical protein